MRPLSKIALVALANLAASYADKPKPPAFYTHARPYLEAMLALRSCDEQYFYDSGNSIVRYALANLSAWRGAYAASIKAELREHLDAFAALGPQYFSRADGERSEPNESCHRESAK